MNMRAEPSNELPLAGVKVLDLGHQIAGPYCARLLADQGADVIKIERPGTGDIARAMGPFAGGDPHPEKSLNFLYLNTNKRSTAADLKSEGGRAVVRDLVRKSDIVVENFRPGFLASLGLGYDDLAAINPRIIVTSISNFGQTGPRKDWRGNDLIDYAVSGIMSMSGTADRPPLKHGQFQAGYVGGLAAVAPTLAALFMREADGSGQHVDVAIAEALISTLVLTIPYYAYMGETQARRVAVGESFANPTHARDGWVIAHSPRSSEWSDFCAVVDAPTLADPKFTTLAGKIAHAEELDRLLGEALSRHDRFTLFHHANAKKILFGVVQTPKDLADCAQLAARGFFHEVDHPVAGRISYPGQAYATSDVPYSIRLRPPLLGEHTDDVLSGELGYDAAKIAGLRNARAI